MFSVVGEGDDFEWVAQNFEGRSQGLLVLWRRGCFVLNSEFNGRNFLGFEGAWGKDQLSVTIVHVCAHCDSRGKKLLWEEIVNVKKVKGGERWCLLGDFNSIKSPTERKRVDGYNMNEEMQIFGEFISEAGLIDLPLIGRKFTWYKSDRKTMSRLDRFLITKNWLNSWCDLSQWGLQRSVSDHCTIVLKEINLGPKPFHMMRYWEEMV